MYYDDYDSLDELIDSTESLEVMLEYADLTIIQAEENTKQFINHFKELCQMYSLPLNNKAKFCQMFYQIIDNVTRQDGLWLYTAVLRDKGLLFDNDRTERTMEQDIRCYLTMRNEMEKFTIELNRQAIQNRKFYKLKQQLKKGNIPMAKSVNEEDVYFIFQTYKDYFPADNKSSSKILMGNITLLCELLENSKELMTIAPLFIYQIVSKYRTRLCNTEDFNFDIAKLFTNKSYQINTDNGKNFDNMTALISFFLDLCQYFSKNLAVDVELSLHVFAELSNLCEWVYTSFEDNEEITLPIPLVVMIARCQIDCFERGIDYGACNEDIIAFFSHIESYTEKIEGKVESYLATKPGIIQQYIDNLYGGADSNRHIIYQIFDNANLPTPNITPEKLPIIYTTINILLDSAVNDQIEAVLLEIGKKVVN